MELASEDKKTALAITRSCRTLFQIPEPQLYNVVHLRTAHHALSFQHALERKRSRGKYVRRLSINHDVSSSNLSKLLPMCPALQRLTSPPTVIQHALVLPQEVFIVGMGHPKSPRRSDFQLDISRTAIPSSAITHLHLSMRYLYSTFSADIIAPINCLKSVTHLAIDSIYSLDANIIHERLVDNLHPNLRSVVLVASDENNYWSLHPTTLLTPREPRLTVFLPTKEESRDLFLGSISIWDLVPSTPPNEKAAELQ
ncbi:hypothetical protein SISNIDRAFT_454145 [Sistotremastrum niveocremeum HHB9708]|uniref:Uncharacterized protein n=1 Tax=Sistotremastrum niveocremeum HHB9708 TaxID=1314777 RepID=A0A164V182_9AGAM|nr:hypothetical protein SISNIDRAFT_454145 [Sistotremastrum niveocremeum HHB9708]